MNRDAQRVAEEVYLEAVRARDELRDPARALALFEQVLDLDPRMLRAFEAINKELTLQREWAQLAEAFRRMLARVAGLNDTQLEFNLRHNLGVIYRDRLANVELALEAFAQASRLRPEDLPEQRIVAELSRALQDRSP